MILHKPQTAVLAAKQAKTMKKSALRHVAPALLCALLLCAACADTANPQAPAKQAFPQKNMRGIVQWGAGGGTDALMRPLAALAEQELGVSIVVQNMAGAAGSIATQYVFDEPADGYTLLMGAENPALYEALEISEYTYADFACVFLIGDEAVGIMVGANSPYTSFEELVQAALIEPGTVRLSTTGKGGLPWAVGAFITDITGATFKQIPYDSDASAKTAVLGGECDFTVCKVQSGMEDYRAGLLNYLCMFTSEPVPALENVPPITAGYPAFEKYLPWGPFYGVFVKRDTDPAALTTLREAFKTAGAEAGYQDVLKNFNVNYLGYTGGDAESYMQTWQENTLYALQASGALR